MYTDTGSYLFFPYKQLTLKPYGYDFGDDDGGLNDCRDVYGDVGCIVSKPPLPLNSHNITCRRRRQLACGGHVIKL